MITFDAILQQFTLRTGDGDQWTIQLVDDVVSHSSFVPGKVGPVIPPERCVRPEAQVRIFGQPATQHENGQAAWASFGARARYSGHEIQTTPRGWRLLLRQADPASGVLITHDYEVGSNDGVMRRRTHVANTSNQVVRIELLSSFCLESLGPFPNRSDPSQLLLHLFRSHWCSEGRLETTTAHEWCLKELFGGRTIDSTGSWSCGTYQPFFAVEDREHGICWAGQIEHSGSWRLEFHEIGQRLGVQGGLASFEGGAFAVNLRPGESFTTPPAALAVASGGLEEVCQKLRDHQSRWLVPQCPSEAGLPVIYNEYFTTWGNPTQKSVRAAMAPARKMGVEVFVIDSGWYCEPGQRWSPTVGDWQQSLARFPGGLAEMAREIRDMGMIPGLWLEPEVIGTESRAFTALEPFMQRRNGRPIFQACRRFLNFADARARQHMRQVIDRIVGEWGFGYLKFDFNESAGPGCDLPDRVPGADDALGYGQFVHLAGLFDWLDAIRRDYPDLIIENCASGGMRNDYGMLSRTHVGSLSDCAFPERWPVLAANTNHFIAPRQQLIWATLKPECDQRELIYRLSASMMGRMTLSGDLAKLSAASQTLAGQAIAFYQRWRDVLAEPLVRHYTPLNDLLAPRGWQAVSLADRASGRSLLFVHRFDSLESQLVIPERKQVVEQFGDAHVSRMGDDLIVTLAQHWSGVVIGLR